MWSAKNNHADLPTDCPTRERHGWSGDAQIFCPTASFLFDYLPFGKKYLRDLYDWQKKNGCLPQIAPEGGTDFYMASMNGSVGWADAGVLMPYALWKQYGDLEVLREYLPGMRRYAGFMQRRCGRWYPTAKRTGLRGAEKKYLSNAGQSYGEWAEPEDVHHMTWKDCAVPHPEVATAYTVRVMECMAEIEAALGNAPEAQAYRSFAARCRTSYQALRRLPAYTLDTDRQAQLVRPLAFGLLDEAQTAYARKRLVLALDHYGWRVGTGFLSTPLILDVLADVDIEAAYRLLENEEMPGWLFMPKHGATTVWEAWEGTATENSGIASLNHYSKGAVCRWRRRPPSLSSAPWQRRCACRAPVPAISIPRDSRSRWRTCPGPSMRRAATGTERPTRRCWRRRGRLPAAPRRRWCSRGCLRGMSRRALTGRI